MEFSKAHRFYTGGKTTKMIFRRKKDKKCYKKGIKKAFFDEKKPQDTPSLWQKAICKKTSETTLS